MTTAAVAPTPIRHAPTTSPWTGTALLLRLALRRDRVRLGIWVAVLTLLMAYAPAAIKLAYPEEAQRLARVNLLKTPAGMMMGGPMFGRNETDLGAMMANEMMLTLIVSMSILAILTVIRHTRAEEESGAAELVLSSVVGRYARTAAALILVGAVNAVLTVTMTLAMVVSGFDLLDAAAMCLGVAGVAMVFGAVAAVTAQLWRQARTATGAAMAVLAVGRAGPRDRRRHRQHGQRVELVLTDRVGSTDARVRRPAVVAVRVPGRADRGPDGVGRRAWRAGVSTTTAPFRPPASTPMPAPINGVLGLHVTLQRGQTDRLDHRVVPRRPRIRVDDQVPARRGRRQRGDPAGDRATGHRQRLHHDDAVPRRRGERLRRRRRAAGVHRRGAGTRRGGARRIGVAVALASRRRSGRRCSARPC